VKLVAVQYEFKLEKYYSLEVFLESLERHFSDAESRLGRLEGSIVTFPEHIGTFLIFMDERLGVGKIDEALAKIAIRRFPSFILKALQARSFKKAILTVKWKDIWKTYMEAFRRLALEYKSVIVAGSLIEPVEPGRIYNMSYVFNAEGKVICKQAKVHLDIPEVQLGITPGDLNTISVCRANEARLGVAICLDAFKDDVVSRLVRQGANILVQPSANPEPWDERVEREWKNSSWLMVQKYPELKYGINPMGVGRILDLEFEGLSSIVAKPDETMNGTGYLARADNPRIPQTLAVEIEENLK
jgi:predicted amidohydrolase